MRIDTNSFKIFLIVAITFLFTQNSFGQVTVRVDEQISPDNIVIFYVGDFDLKDASSNPLIFQYRISADAYPVEVVMRLQMNATVPSLSLSNEQILFALTDPFTITAPITISNRVIDESTEEIIDEAGNVVNFSVARTEQLDAGTQDELVDAVTRSGKLPAGVYTFELLVTSTDASDPSTIYSFENPKIIEISNPTTLDLIAPGGSLSEELEIFTLFPIFQWESQGCEYFIRLSEYDPTVHSSVEEALNDISNLPFPDDGGYFGGDDGEGLQSTTLQYPLTGAKELEYGKYYAWSVRKICETTAGPEIRNSDIYVFRVANLAGDADAGPAAGGVITDPVISALQTIIGDAFDGLFSGDGELAGFVQVSNIVLNGEAAAAEAVTELAEKMLSGEITAVQIEIE
ncbi:MAG: hypothetical protein IIB39_08615 [Candidatus Marinimicrobia bacterium]|nr:hypothetical protein [Candidatus Neomarinimicrobiota bacterium]